MRKLDQLDWSLLGEYIAELEPTRGSETSQYPEEKKSNEILLVAASERRKGQTVRIRPCGVIGPRHWTNDGSRSLWKEARYRVIGPYATPELALECS